MSTRPKRAAKRKRSSPSVDDVCSGSGSSNAQGPSKKAKCQPTYSGPYAEVVKECGEEPVRNSKGFLCFKDHPEFRPNLTPKQVLQRGSFGGTYFRPINSGVTGVSYSNAHLEYPTNWFKGLKNRQVVSPDYDASINTYDVKCGGDLHMWESSGWISNLDPYGWFQWYCRFYQGRRSTDDKRQIARARGVMSEKGRFRNMLIGKCARGGRSYDDVSVSPVVRQTLQHWAYELTEDDANAYVKLKKLPTLLSKSKSVAHCDSKESKSKTKATTKSKTKTQTKTQTKGKVAKEKTKKKTT